MYQYVPVYTSINPFQKSIENDAIEVQNENEPIKVQNEMFTFEINSENAIVGCTLER
jgi:hypothetical protein